MIIMTWFCILLLSCPESHTVFPCLIDTEFSIVPVELYRKCFLVPSGIKIWQPLLPQEFLFSLKSLHSMTQSRERKLLFILTLQTREARLHRIHSKAGNWTQISWIPREYLTCTTTLLILRAGQAVMNHWRASRQQLPSSLFLKVSEYRSDRAESKLWKPRKYSWGSNSPMNPKFRS